jgi:hypothetical protein
MDEAKEGAKSWPGLSGSEGWDGHGNTDCKLYTAEAVMVACKLNVVMNNF